LPSNRIFGQGHASSSVLFQRSCWGQLVDVFVFHECAGNRQQNVVASRDRLDTDFSLVDSFVVLYIAFSGVLPISKSMAIGITNYIYKFTMAILLRMLLLWALLYRSLLGKEHANRIAEEAASHE